jgi:hypothetical protein
MASYHTLNKFLPKELTRLALEWTGGIFKNQMREVIEEISVYNYAKASDRFWGYVAENSIWDNGNILGDLDYIDSNVLYTDSTLMGIIEEIVECEITETQWDDIKTILNDVANLGWSVFEACTIISCFVLDAPASDEETELIGEFVHDHSQYVDAMLAAEEEVAERGEIVTEPYIVDDNGFLIRNWE